MTPLQAILTLALPAAVAFGAWEVRRWHTPAGELISPRQRRIRIWGLVFLFATLALWLRATYLPIPHSHGGPPTPAERRAAAEYIGFLTLTVLCALPLFPLALLDSRENLRRLQAERQRLAEERAALVNDYILKGTEGTDAPDPKPAP